MSEPTHPSAVFYCDGGFIMDSKPMYNYKANLGSIGIHGYTYNLEEPKKGTGNSKVIPTAQGYLKKEASEGVPKVTVGGYVDMSMGIPAHKDHGYASSNQVELRALMETCKWILSEGTHLTNIQIKSDSKYTVQGTNEWAAKWKKNNWRNSTGNEIKYKGMWIETTDLIQLVKRQCVDGFDLSWLRGHDGHVGNEVADALATRGLALAANGIQDIQIKLSDIAGYWKMDNESPRILQAPRWYCSTTDLDFIDEEGRYTYYVGCHGSKDKEDELAGKRYADNFLGVVKISEPDPVMEELRQRYIRSTDTDLSNILITHLDVLFSPKQYREVKEQGWKYTIDKIDKIELVNANNNLIVTEMDPIGQGFRMNDVWKNLKRIMEEIQVEATASQYQRLEITHLFYDMDEKKGVYKIKPTMTQLVKKVDIKAPFNLSKNSEPIKVNLNRVTLILGMDLLSRNQLAAIAADVESIELITWRESDEVGRYGTFVKLKNGDHGMWCRYDANMMLVKKTA